MIIEPPKSIRSVLQQFLLIAVASGLVGCGKTLNTSLPSEAPPPPTPITGQPKLKPVPAADVASSVKVNQVGQKGYQMRSAVGVSASKVDFKTTGGYQVFLSAAGQIDSTPSKTR